MKSTIFAKSFASSLIFISHAFAMQNLPEVLGTVEIIVHNQTNSIVNPWENIRLAPHQTATSLYSIKKEWVYNLMLAGPFISIKENPPYALFLSWVIYIHPEYSGGLFSVDVSIRNTKLPPVQLPVSFSKPLNMRIDVTLAGQHLENSKVSIKEINEPISSLEITMPKPGPVTSKHPTLKK